MIVILMSSPNSLDFLILSSFVFNAKKPTLKKTIVTIHVAKLNVTPVFNPIAVTTNYSNKPKNQNYHAKTVIVISMESRVK